MDDLEAQTPSNSDKEVTDVKLEEKGSNSEDGHENIKKGGAISFATIGRHQHGQKQYQDHHDWHFWSAHKLPHRSSDAHALARAEAASWAQMTPLIAATLGPLAVLLGIPSLTQKLHADIIYNSDGTITLIEQPYPHLNLALSIVVTILETLGNFFLILRFSNFHSKLMTWLSYGFWCAKSVVGIANYIQFGLAHPETVNVVYLQGFWVGVCSMTVTVIILVALTYNLAFLHTQSPTDTRRLHHVQREFMVQTLIFFFFIGVWALIFSQTESLTYVDGIYFVVVTTLTIGFGDITPHTAAMKVLIFPFTVVGITLLAVIVTSIIRLLLDRAQRRKLQTKKQLKAKASESKRKAAAKAAESPERPRLKRSLTLQEELNHLAEADWKRQTRNNLRSVAIGLAVFFAFWFLGALIFCLIEDWGYGNALYFCYMLRFFLTIGYGDFFPVTAAGKSVFIVYALLAVPTMTIVVQTVTSNFTSYTTRRLQRQKHQVYKAKDFEIQSLTSLVNIAKAKTEERLDTDGTSEVKLPIHDVAERVMESLQHMHHHLQNFMMQKLGTDARNIITAERARQASTVKQIETKMKKQGEPEQDVPRHLSEIGQEHGHDELELLNEYRLRYAGIMGQLLVAKDKLLELEVGLKNNAANETLRRTLSEDIEELEDLNEIDYARSQRRKRRSSEF